MSDTTQPAAAPPSQPTPQPTSPPQQQAPPPSTEVPVSETPVSTPTPIGSQAPPKPPAVARHEALEKAFSRAREAQDEAAKAKRPGMGHNQPPEAMAKEKPAPDKAAEKAERTSQPSEQQQRYREAGKFARDPAKPELPQPAQQQAAKTSVPTIKPLDETAPYRVPPGRFSEQAKVEWAAAPESVRGAVYTMAREFKGAYDRYQGDHKVMEELRPYQDIAVKQGTSLRKAFDNYYAMEQKLRQDLIGGLDTIVRNLSRSQGLKGIDGGPLTINDVAHHVLSMTPEQHQLVQQRNQQTSAEMQIGKLYQQVEQQNRVLTKMVYDQRFTGTRVEVDKFADTHPRFDELSDLIKTELDLGFSLEQAYARADRLRPSLAPQAAQTRNTPAQTRKTSISGAPDGGNGAATTRPSAGQRRNGEAKHPTRQEALAKAYRRVANGV